MIVSATKFNTWGSADDKLPPNCINFIDASENEV